MALFKYFKKSALPNPDGPLSNHIPSTSIIAANKEVQPVLDSQASESNHNSSRKRGHYANYTDAEKTKVGKRAAEMGVTSTIRYFEKDFTDRPLKESTVRTWKNEYIKELALQNKFGSTKVVLKGKRRGHPLLLGDKLDREVQEYVKSIREMKGVINTAIVIAAANGIIKKYDANLLKENGGHISLSKDWAKSLLTRLGYVKRRASTAAKVSVSDFEAYKAQFVFDIQTVMEMEEIPKDLVINWDHTGINYVPVGNWTMAEKGSKKVAIAGVDDKRQITAVFADTMSGDFLPIQILYAGKTK